MKHEPWKEASATLRTPDGRLHYLEPGDLVGRLWSAALYLPDPRVSECHGALSIVEGQPTLLGLRGRFRVEGVVMRDVPLAPGLEIELAPGVAVEVVAMEHPSLVLHVVTGAGSPRPVHGVTTLRAGGESTTLWRSQTWLRTTSGGPVAVTEGAIWMLGGREMQARWMPVRSARRTRAAEGGVHRLSFDAKGVTLSVGAEEVRLRGRSAQLLWELSCMHAPVHWWQVAGELWEAAPEATLRPRWDMLLSRLRRRIRSIGGNPGLIHADGQGLVQLLLSANDQVVGVLDAS